MGLSDATVTFAFLLGALVWAAEIAPAKQAAPVAVATSTDDLLSIPASPKCALETWPNITTDCLRNAIPDRRLADARPILALRQ